MYIYIYIYIYIWVYIKCVYKINVLNVHCTMYIVYCTVYKIHIEYNYMHALYMCNKPSAYILVTFCAHK